MSGPVEQERWERGERHPICETAGDPAAPVRPGPVAPVRETFYERNTAVARYDPRAERIIWFVVAFVASLIAIRFFGGLRGAASPGGFWRCIAGSTAPAVARCHGGCAGSGSGNYIQGPECLMAIAIYVLIGWALVPLIRILRAPRTRPVV